MLREARLAGVNELRAELDSEQVGVSLDVNVGSHQSRQSRLLQSDDITCCGLNACPQVFMVFRYSDNDSRDSTVAEKEAPVHGCESNMSLEAHCVHHPTRLAARACARCGSFICSGCIVSNDLCSECKALLNRQGIPYSPDEVSRATARKCFRWARRGVQLLFAVGVTMIGFLFFTGSAILQGASVVTTVLLGVLSIGIGIGVAGLSSWGLLKSESGRPSASVAGVFPRTTAAFFILVGVSPALCAVALLQGQSTVWSLLSLLLLLVTSQ
jgi:hypothetical protein